MVKDKPSRQKVSYVKLFKPFNWVIGTGVYIDNVTEALQKKIRRKNNGIEKISVWWLIASYGVIPLHEGAIVFSGLLILLLIPILYEFEKFKKVSSIYLWNLPLYFITLIVFAAVIPMPQQGQSAVSWFN